MTNTAALLTAATTDVSIQDRDVPTPGAGEVLIRNHAVALNPIDWKRQAWGFAISSYPTILGTGK
jgi:NADPH:quinone reductase-like Zn-dependent oxidoreductase